MAVDEKSKYHGHRPDLGRKVQLSAISPIQ